jgi:hypothetical protein
MTAPKYEPNPTQRFPPPDEASDRGWQDVPPEEAKIPPAIGERSLVADCAPLVVLALLFATANVAVLPLMDTFRQRDWGAVWVYLSIGLIVAQGGSLPFWLVFGRGSFLARLIVFWAGVAVMGACWGAGAIVATSMHAFLHVYDDEVRFFALSLPLAALAIQLPLWPLKLFCGWSVVKWDVERDDAPVGEANRPLAIRDYLIGTAIVAVAFTCARVAPRHMPSNYWIVWLIFAASVAGTSLISIVPAMLLMLRRTNGLPQTRSSQSLDECRPRLS